MAKYKNPLGPTFFVSIFLKFLLSTEEHSYNLNSEFVSVSRTQTANKEKIATTVGKTNRNITINKFVSYEEFINLQRKRSI